MTSADREFYLFLSNLGALYFSFLPDCSGEDLSRSGDSGKDVGLTFAIEHSFSKPSFMLSKQSEQ